MERKPEPELMDSEEQTQAYAEADFEESNALFTRRFSMLSRTYPEPGTWQTWAAARQIFASVSPNDCLAGELPASTPAKTCSEGRVRRSWRLGWSAGSCCATRICRIPA